MRPLAAIRGTGKDGRGGDRHGATAGADRLSRLAYYPDYTYVECRPQTGRKHQIRVHMAYIGFPIVGDHLYGRRKDKWG